MWGRVFPKVVDNKYRGHWLGLVLLGAICAVKALQGVESMVNTHDTAINADGIPLDTYPPDAAANVMIMFALLGMYLLVIPLQSAAVLLRWRALVPFMFLSLLAVQLGARAVHFWKEGGALDLSNQPIGFWVNSGIIAVTIIGFLLSVMDRSKPAASEGIR